MQIEIKLDENCKEPKIIVVTNKMTDEIKAFCRQDQTIIRNMRW